tara:strand:+ start:375 stop:500 length:126 start_codon:yes stop_codon:yes gene_type:complete
VVELVVNLEVKLRQEQLIVGVLVEEDLLVVQVVQVVQAVQV